MPISIIPSSLPDATQGIPYAQAVAAVGGTPPYLFMLTAGTMPAGMTLNGSAVTGTPTGTTTGTFTITATDANGLTGSRSYSTEVLGVSVVVEDGTGVDGANSYLDLPTMKSMQDALGVGTMIQGDYSNLSLNMQSALVIYGTAYLDRRFRYYGLPLQQGQALEWPRTKNYDNQGFVIDPGTIPDQMLRALALIVSAAAVDPELQTFENTADPLRVQSASAEGISFSYSALAGDPGIVPLFEARLPDLQVLLRSIGELKAADFVGTDKQTIVQRTP